MCFDEMKLLTNIQKGIWMCLWSKFGYTKGYSPMHDKCD
uniref:Uncharacterized protein n=1 Tax=Lepeophtheirus salmonis TaxID=72036 RepID=A0A0K2V004_LEPSM